MLRVITIAVVLWGAVAVPVAGQWDPASGAWGKEHPGDLRIMTWNVKDAVCRTNDKLEGPNNWTAVARIIAAIKPDILLIQEAGDNTGNGSGSGVDSVSQLQVTLGLLFHGGTDPYNGGTAITSWVQKYDPGYDATHYFVGSQTDGFNRNVIVSRFPFTDLNGDFKATISDIFVVSADEYAPGGDGGIRGFQFAEIDLPAETYGGDVVIGNAHLKAGGSQDDQDQRRIAAQNTVYFMDYLLNGAGTGLPDPHGRIADSPAVQTVLEDTTPVIYGGDWNEDEATNGQKGPAEWLASAEFIGSDDGADRDRSDATYDDAREPFTNNRNTLSSSKVDYLAWQDSIVVLRRAFVFDSTVVPGAGLPPEIVGLSGGGALASDLASDHLPVIADLILPPGMLPCSSPAECDDGVACTVDDCVDEVCMSTPDPGLCDDGIACTDETCDPFSGCSSVPNDDRCADGVSCTLDVCSVAAGGCVLVPDHNACDDGTGCTVGSCDPVADCQYVSNGLCDGVDLLAVTGSGDCAEPDLAVCTLAVHFDDLADRLLSIGFADISTNDPDGFFQAKLGGNTAPSEVFVDLFPILACDSYVTIGLQTVPSGVTDTTALDPDFDPAGFNCEDPPADCGVLRGGWFNSNPANDQGVPNINGEVMVAQLVVRQPFDIWGTLSIFFNTGTLEAQRSFVCLGSCTGDLDGNGTVDAADLALLLGAWGSNPGAAADLNGDGVVDAADLAELLGHWGPC